MMFIMMTMMTICDLIQWCLTLRAVEAIWMISLLTKAQTLTKDHLKIHLLHLHHHCLKVSHPWSSLASLSSCQSQGHLQWSHHQRLQEFQSSFWLPYLSRGETSFIFPPFSTFSSLFLSLYFILSSFSSNSSPPPQNGNFDLVNFAEDDSHDDDVHLLIWRGRKKEKLYFDFCSPCYNWRSALPPFLGSKARNSSPRPCFHTPDDDDVNHDVMVTVMMIIIVKVCLLIQNFHFGLQHLLSGRLRYFCKRNDPFQGLI